MATHLKLLLNQRHLQAHGAFCREYDRVAGANDPGLVGSWPSRATLHRWMAGAVQRLPYPDHCRVLEAMFPGWTVERLLQDCDEPRAVAVNNDVRVLTEKVREGLTRPEPGGAWPPGIASGTAPVDVLPPLGEQTAASQADPAPRLSRQLLALERTLRLPPEETCKLARFAGLVVDLELNVSIAIEPAGESVVSYTHKLLNLSPEPLHRLNRQIWFKHTEGPKLKIVPSGGDNHKMLVQRVHDIQHFAQFACQFSPAVEPAEVVEFGYTCYGGRFLEDYHWRQDLVRATRHATIAVRQRRATLLKCSAVEEHVNGFEAFVTGSIVWDQEGPDLTITLARNYLNAGQALTLRWETER